METIEVRNILVDIVRKDIKNVHVAVYPPDGRVRISVPKGMSKRAVRLAIVDKLIWIRRQQEELEAQPRQTEREMVSGENHYVWGERKLLKVRTHDGPNRVCLQGAKTIEMYVSPDADAERRYTILQEWYRSELKARIPQIISVWQPKVGVKVDDWGVRKMKTKWGSCTIQDGRIWINLELAKKPLACLKYIVVHEMTHLLERHHNDRFRAHLDRVMPNWRLYRKELNAAPLAHEDWDY